jgi:hypothetical protein
MNNTRGIMNFDEPPDYHLITEYANSDRSTYGNIRKNRPDIIKIQSALNGFIENCIYENNYQNSGYITALNFKIE